MGLESASYISELVATNPLGTDARSQGDEHIRLIKSVLLGAFANVDAAVSVTQDDINQLANWDDIEAVTFGTNASHYDINDLVRVSKTAGMVYLSGAIQQDSNPTNTSTTFATLPTGYRPLVNVHALAVVYDFGASSVALHNLKISTAGVITINTPGFTSVGPVVLVLSQVRFYFASYN